MISELFRKFVELPKPVVVNRRVGLALSPEQFKRLGYVKVDNGWTHHSHALRLPMAGKMVWMENEWS